MADRPILFSGPMVRAILDGRKTVTRRVIKRENAPEPGNTWADCCCREIHPSDTPCVVCHARFGLSPYGEAGDRLWVRETWKATGFAALLPISQSRLCGRFAYAADAEQLPRDASIVWRPSIHMPRWASRLTLDVVSVRAERLHDITDTDALREGIEPMPVHLCEVPNYRRAFSRLWDSLNAERAPWDSNPWVWRVKFACVEVPRG